MRRVSHILRSSRFRNWIWDGMRPETSRKIWRWLGASFLASAALAFLNSRMADVSLDANSMSQAMLEQKLLSVAGVDSQGNKVPWISDILVHPVRTVVSGTESSRVQMISFKCYCAPDAQRPEGGAEAFVSIVEYPYEPRPSRRAMELQSYPGATKYIAREDDTIDTVEKKFYRGDSTAGRRAIVNANPSLAKSPDQASSGLAPLHAYWIPWNPAFPHSFEDFIEEVNVALRADSANSAGPLRYHYAWWETPLCASLIRGTITLSAILLSIPIFMAFLRQIISGIRGRKPVGRPALTVDNIVGTEQASIRDWAEACTKDSDLAAKAHETPSPKSIQAAPIQALRRGSEIQIPASPVDAISVKQYHGEYYPVEEVTKSEDLK
jgi:phage tail protein X